MSDDTPAESGLPTLGELIANWLGFQLPSIPMPQTVKNFDKAAGAILLAASDNAVTRIKSSTAKVKAAGKISVEGMYRTDEEKRKLENRAATVKVAVDELNQSASTSKNADTEIDDDWLNLFAKIAEDKTSEELQSLFGKILAGEIQRPGTFSLRTLQFLSTLSKADAHAISEFLSFTIAGAFSPTSYEDIPFGPTIHSRILMEELGIASTANSIGGLAWNLEVQPHSGLVLQGIGRGVSIFNGTDRTIKFQLECQALTTTGKEIFKIANPPPTNIEFLKAISQIIFERIRSAGFSDEIVKTRSVVVQAGPFIQQNGQYRLFPEYTVNMPYDPAAA